MVKILDKDASRSLGRYKKAEISGTQECMENDNIGRRKYNVMSVKGMLTFNGNVPCLKKRNEVYLMQGRWTS